MARITAHDLRAKALRVFALLLGGLMLGACATTSDDYAPSPIDKEADFAIYVARIVDMDFIELPPCPEDHICLSALFDLTLEPVETVAGHPGVGRQTFRVLQHSAYRDDIALLAHVRRDGDGKWQLIGRRVVSLNVCISADAQKDMGDLNATDSRWFLENDGEDGEACLSRSYRVHNGADR